VGVVARWREAVGDVVADHAKPVSLEAGRLLVEVDDPGWATQLRYLESTLVEQLAAVLGTGVVTRVNVRVRR
jgi:predicted nucleic acid-binding Zn ribbon protein